MESFTIELVPNASTQLFPEKTLSSSTNFLQDQLNLDGQWDVAISELSDPSMYQNATEGNFMFCDTKLSKSLESYDLEPGLNPSNTDIVKAMNTLIQERHNHSENCIKLKCLEKRKRLRFTLQMKHPVLHSLVGICDTYSEVMLVMNLE